MTEVLQSKVCSKCKIEKPIDEFGILNRSKDGHSPVCFLCRRKSPKPKHRQGRPLKIISPVVSSSKRGVKDESEDNRLFSDFRKGIIGNFIKSDLIPMLEKLIKSERLT